MSKAEKEANKRYNITRGDDTEETSGIDMQRTLDFIDGYHQAEKNLELTYEDIKDRFLSEFLAKTLSRKLGINRMPECEKEECNKTYIPDPYSPDRSKYPYFEAYKEGYLAAISIAEDILVKMFNEYDNLTKD